MLNMSQVGIGELEEKASTVIADVVAGETVVVTDHGQPVAQISAISRSPLANLLSSGQARAAKSNICDLPSPKPGPNISAELAAMRDAERSNSHTPLGATTRRAQ